MQLPKNCLPLQVMAGQPVCHLVATDWYKSTKKMDALASRPGNKVMQVWLHVFFKLILFARCVSMHLCILLS